MPRLAPPCPVLPRLLFRRDRVKDRDTVADRQLALGHRHVGGLGIAFGGHDERHRRGCGPGLGDRQDRAKRHARGIGIDGRLARRILDRQPARVIAGRGIVLKTESRPVQGVRALRYHRVHQPARVAQVLGRRTPHAGDRVDDPLVEEPDLEVVEGPLPSARVLEQRAQRVPGARC